MNEINYSASYVLAKYHNTNFYNNNNNIQILKTKSNQKVVLTTYIYPYLFNAKPMPTPDSYPSIPAA